MFVLSLFGLIISSAVVGADPTTRPTSDWPIFRGNGLQTGVAVGSLPDRPEVQWRFTVGDVIQSTAALVGDAVYVGCDDGFLYALDLRSGSLRWKFEAASAIRSSPTVHEGLVYFGDEAGVLHALSAANGREAWTYRTGAEIVSSVNPAGDRLLFGSYDGFLYCLARGDGRLLWKFETQGRVHGTPAVSDGHVIVAGCDEHLRVVRLTDGSAVGASRMGGVSGASAAVVGDRAYVGTFSNQVLCVDWLRGKRLWVFQNPDREFPFYASAAVADGLVVVGGRDKNVYGLDAATGKQVWSFRTQARVDSSPVILGDRAWVGSSDGNLYALDLRTGAERWRFATGAALVASPAIGQGKLVIGADDGVIYCFGERVAERGTQPSSIEGD